LPVSRPCGGFGGLEGRPFRARGLLVLTDLGAICPPVSRRRRRQPPADVLSAVAGPSRDRHPYHGHHYQAPITDTGPGPGEEEKIPMAATLQEILLAPATRPQVLADCHALLEQEVASMSGTSATPGNVAY